MRIFLLLTLFVTSSVSAEETYITIPGENWTLMLETPPITSSKLEVSNRLVRYVGSSVETGVTLSVNTETEASKNNRECFEVFWSKAQNNPVMVKASIRTKNNNKAYYATHRSEGEYKGQAFKIANGHAYFVKNGICVDLHVSHWPFTSESEIIVSNILESLKIIE